MAVRTFLAAGAALFAVILRAEGPASSELHNLLLADSLLVPTLNPLTPIASSPEKVPFTLGPEGQPPSDPFIPRLAEDRVTEFFRTGILLSDHSEHPLKKLSVGPCEGGQLLNLRTNW